MQIFEAIDYQPRATQLFEQHCRHISRQFADARIEHVGASSIPGARSRGDVDICVIVPLVRHAGCVLQLEEAGYRIKADTLRSNELCMLVARDSLVPVAVQLIAAGSRFEFFMQFRDALRANADLLARYNDAKIVWAEGSEERYRAAKSAFIEAVLRGEHLT